MASNQGRLFSSIIKLSASRLRLSCGTSESTTLSAKRLFSSSTQDPSPEDDASTKVEGKETESQTAKLEEAEDDGDELDLNTETGEIGGPRGPEPTRYGDWEKNGRCYDF